MDTAIHARENESSDARLRISSCRPNYADSLLSPFQGSNIHPFLRPGFDHVPIRIFVVDDGYLYSSDILSLIKASCERWASATKNSPGGGLVFEYSHGTVLQSADIVFSLIGVGDGNARQASTLPIGGSEWIQLGVVDSKGFLLPYRRVGRVATHELGHALGISGHSPNPKDVMSLNPDATEVSQSDGNTLRLAYHGSFRR